MKKEFFIFDQNWERDSAGSLFTKWWLWRNQKLTPVGTFWRETSRVVVAQNKIYFWNRLDVLITNIIYRVCKKKSGPKENAIKRSKTKIIICKFGNFGPDSVKFPDYNFSPNPLSKRSESRFFRKACLAPPSSSTLWSNQKSTNQIVKKWFKILIQRILCWKSAQSWLIDCSLQVCSWNSCQRFLTDFMLRDNVG